MYGKRPPVNRGADTAADLSPTRDRIEHLRARIAGGDHWILATDDAVGAGFALSFLGATLGPSDAFLTRENVFVKNRGLLALVVLAVAKSRVSAEEVAAFLSGYTGHDRAEVVRLIRAGADVFPVACADDVVAGCLDAIGKGKCFAYDAAAN